MVPSQRVTSLEGFSSLQGKLKGTGHLSAFCDLPQDLPALIFKRWYLDMDLEVEEISVAA